MALSLFLWDSVVTFHFASNMDSMAKISPSNFDTMFHACSNTSNSSRYIWDFFQQDLDDAARRNFIMKNIFVLVLPSVAGLFENDSKSMFLFILNCSWLKVKVQHICDVLRHLSFVCMGFISLGLW